VPFARNWSMSACFFASYISVQGYLIEVLTFGLHVSPSGDRAGF
ncbi:hypothetical protein PCS70012_02334, partial [Streptococcus pneumoniae PCS70012]